MDEYSKQIKLGIKKLRETRNIEAAIILIDALNDCREKHQDVYEFMRQTIEAYQKVIEIKDEYIQELKDKIIKYEKENQLLEFEF